MLGSPRIVAIDDQEEHLAGLADCLNRNGVACLQIRFTGDPTEIPACPDVRVIFADLQLVPGPRSDHMSDFKASAVSSRPPSSLSARISSCCGHSIPTKPRGCWKSSTNTWALA